MKIFVTAYLARTIIIIWRFCNSGFSDSPWGYEELEPRHRLNITSHCKINEHVESVYRYIQETEENIVSCGANGGVGEIITLADNYCQPDLGATAEFNSLVRHSQYFKRSYESIKPDEFSLIRTDISKWNSKENYMKCFVILITHQHHPYCREYPTIGDWLGFNGIYFNDF